MQKPDLFAKGPFAEHPLDAPIRDAILEGYPDPLPVSKAPNAGPQDFGAEPNPQWEVMQLWEMKMEEASVARPRSIKGADELSTLYWFMADLCPFFFNSERWLRSMSEEQLQEIKAEQGRMLDGYLKEWGY